MRFSLAIGSINEAFERQWRCLSTRLRSPLRWGKKSGSEHGYPDAPRLLGKAMILSGTSQTPSCQIDAWRIYFT
jgi:hypothetical protein